MHGVSLDVSAAVTNLFVAHNRMHDWAYGLGFTETAWNAQKRNFGLTQAWQQGDPVTGNAQAGAGLTTAEAFAVGARNNANMATLADGLSSITNMYLWQPSAGAFYGPCADGDYDMPIIGHEYGHMIENRMIGKGGTRQGNQAGMMGESHGDLFGMEYVNSNGFSPLRARTGTPSARMPPATSPARSATTAWACRSRAESRCRASSSTSTR